MGKKALLFYITLFLFILVYSTTASHVDYDLWARLIAGMGVIDGGHVLKTDFLSYTPVHTWWDHEWGSGVIFYACFKYLGAYSLIILQGLMIFGIFFIASRIIKMRDNKNPYNILFYFFTLMALMTNLNQPIRCHLFSFLFFTLFIYIFEKVRRGNNKLLFLVPLIIIFWNNVHGGVVAGLGLMVMYAVGEFLNRKPFKNYLITLAVSFLMLFINPWGYEYLKFLFMANTMQRPDIVEWFGIFSKFQLFKQITFKMFMFGMIIIELLSIYKNIKLTSVKEWYNKADKVKYIILLSTLYLAISHVKMIPFFGIAALCFIYEDFYRLIEKLEFPAWKDKIVYGLILFLSIFTILTKDFSVPVGFNAYPVKEVEFIRQNNLTGKLLTNFGTGSYASYKLYPHNKIYMDGRYEEVYYTYMLPLLSNFMLAVPGWNRIISEDPPDVMIIEDSYPVYKALLLEPEWKLVYRGKIYGVFIPRTKANRTFKLPSDDYNYYKDRMFDTDINFKSENDNE